MAQSSATPIPIRCAVRKNQLPGNNYIAPQAWRTRVPEELYPTAYVAERTIKYLGKLLTQRARQAILPAVLLSRSASSLYAAGPLLGHVRSQRDSLTAIFQRGRAADHTASAKTLRRAHRQPEPTVTASARSPSPSARSREAIALTYGMITMIDDAIGSILGWLKTLRPRSRHGRDFHQRPRRLHGRSSVIAKRRAALSRPGARAVYLAAIRASRDGGLVNSGLCGTLDIASTILDRAGLAGHNGMQGKSLTAGGRRRRRRVTIRWSSKSTSGAATWDLRITSARAA